MDLSVPLNKEQKEAAGLLQAGTFLEYFDLMLYVHMAVVLNELFFPKTDPKTASLLTAFTFSSIYVLRPLGALLFGYIGDCIGRKTTVILTMMLMATSCILIASLPTYDQIGITAAWLVTACRVIQGISSMGEIIGAEIYLTELIPLPLRYCIVGLISCASRLGMVAALAVAMLMTSHEMFNWRYAFWAAAGLALVGSVSRMRLRETPDFLSQKRVHTKNEIKTESSSKLTFISQKVNFKLIMASFLIYSGPPACLYFIYIFCAEILKQLGQTGQQIIHQNFLISIVEFMVLLATVLLSIRIHPLKIIKLKSIFFLIFAISLPFLMMHALSPSLLFIIQLIGVSLILTAVPAVAALIVHYPIYQRFRYTSIIYALARALMSVIIAFGLVFLTDAFGYWGLSMLLIPVTLGFIWGVTHFEKLEGLRIRSLNPEVT
ncbi:MAG: MFS transporter [Proteobacteria bacterium]|nr:MFS transporter [Pseudomonadota bacterium]